LSAQSNSISFKKTLHIKGQLVDLSTPLVMGILNLTPDSFYSKSRKERKSELLTSADQMLQEGAGILDLGAYSSRPGADHISEEEESKRILQGLKVVRQHFPEAIISVDTFRSQIARSCIENGADIINDISGGALDEAMWTVVSEYRIPYILMHMRGTPQTMTQQNQYEDLLGEIVYELQEKLYQCRKFGIADVIIDPGFGFAKNIRQNFELLKNLKELHILDCPILVGISRKSLIYKTFNSTPEYALNGTTALNMIGLMNGASILRVHDVKEAVECVKLYELAGR
jgi:dihydropteroate synthase